MANVMYFQPSAPWMGPQAFAIGGQLEKTFERFRREHGSRALPMWRASVTRFAGGAPITGATIERHDRQSLEHWALARAAGYATRDAATAPATPTHRVPADVTARVARFLESLDAHGDLFEPADCAFAIVRFILADVSGTLDDARKVLALWNARLCDPLPASALEQAVTHAAQLGGHRAD